MGQDAVNQGDGFPLKHCKLLESQEVADLRIFRVRYDRYHFARTDAEHDFVVLEAPPWVNVVPITDSGQIVLVRQFRHGIREFTLEIPGGVVDDGESPLVAIARELREETGYIAREIRPLGTVLPNPAFQDNRCHMFVALGCSLAGEAQPDPFEQIEVVLHTMEAVPSLIRNGQISHALAIAALSFMGIVASPREG